MAFKRFKCDKLFRDHVPDILRKKGLIVQETMLQQKEFLERLKEKLVEEAEEVKATKTPNELKEELADTLEVLRTLSLAAGFTMEEIEAERERKRLHKGGFEQRSFVHFIDIQDSHEEISYYLKKPHCYPEMQLL